jgi:glucose-6-phosphate 1-dehydrogenase
LWNRSHVESVQVTMAEAFGLQGRGAFYDQTGAIRDVIQNHLFQVLTNLAMELPVRTDSESIRDEKVKVAQGNRAARSAEPGPRAIPQLSPRARGRCRLVGRNFAALRLEIDSWRWKGVPIYIRAGNACR